MYGGPSHGIYTKFDPGRSNCLQVDHLGQVGNIGRYIVKLVGCIRFESSFKRYPFYAILSIAKYFIGSFGDARSDLIARRPAMGRIVFESAIFRRIVRRGDDHTVGQALLVILIMDQDGMRDDRCRRIFHSFWYHDGHPGSGEDFKRAG